MENYRRLPVNVVDAGSACVHGNRVLSGDGQTRQVTRRQTRLALDRRHRRQRQALCQRQARPNAENQMTIKATRPFLNELGTGGVLAPVTLYVEK